MPFTEVTSSMGKTKFKYMISTPNSEEAEQINAGLPTIVFLHPVFLAEHKFKAQFSDRNIRQYNLVSFDCRGHGKTTGDPAPDWYGHIEVVEDMIQLMPTEVAEGHDQIKDLWTSAFPDDETILKDLLHDAEFGEKQFLFSEPQLSSLSSAVNSQLYDFVKNANYNPAPPLASCILQAENPISPWDGLLKEAGWEGEDGRGKMIPGMKVLLSISMGGLWITQMLSSKASSI
ncbi:hypothetical protein F5876DRAFT_81815 [Lentinula aff. lateritia]|uniref:Uncharacterized protein n=1 Tax=Lentinula aff. lateritia TaxID=2804960 RepID=A0ACC1TLE4_9AGAR|nr:hypothetical protein F5876DRAFT_81815 [Lentinula aff. lateritia]